MQHGICEKFLTPQQVRESGSTKTWKAKSRMVICGNFSDQELLCDTSTQNVDIGLLRMMLSITNGKVETLTTTDIANAFLNAPIDESRTILVAVPGILVKLGIVKPGTVWKIRRAVYGLKESPRLWQEERDKVMKNLSWYSEHWKSWMHLVQSVMHPSMWLMTKVEEQMWRKSMSEPVQVNELAQTHTWVKGTIKGRIALFVDDLIQSGHKKSNMEFLQALEKHWKMATPEHLGPSDKHDKLKFIGVMITRHPKTTEEFQEGTYFLGQGAYVLEVLERFSSSMGYRSRTTPGEPDSFTKDQKESHKKQAKLGGREEKFAGEESEEASISSILGALMWIAFRTRPDICWAVTRITRASKSASTMEEVEDKARIQIKHILQYLSMTWNWCLIMVPHSQVERLTIVTDASLAPGGGKSHEGVTVFHGPNLISWRSGKQSLTALSSCEAELVGMVAGVQHGINLMLSLGEITQAEPTTRILCDNAAAISMVQQGPNAVFKTRFISMRGHFIHDLMGAGLVTVEYVPSQENPADALTKGLSSAVHRKARSLLCMTEQEQ